MEPTTFACEKTSYKNENCATENNFENCKPRDHGEYEIKNCIESLFKSTRPPKLINPKAWDVLMRESDEREHLCADAPWICMSGRVYYN
jgi:hypothetical protein